MDAQMFSSYLSYHMATTVLCFIGFLIFLAVAASLLRPRKSQEYRKLLTDMFVAGKIKLLAKADNINLADEEKNFNRWLKKQRLEYTDLDRTVEEELKRKISNVDTDKFTD